jgi:ribosomal protein L9
MALQATRNETAEQKTRSIRRHQDELEELRREFEIRKARIASSLKAEQKVFESVSTSNSRRELELEAEMQANQHDRKMLVGIIHCIIHPNE